MVAVDWLKRSWNANVALLNPTVFTLAMLSPMICMALPRVLKPLMPEKSALDNAIV
jgi:hypothetical protein